MPGGLTAEPAPAAKLVHQRHLADIKKAAAKGKARRQESEDKAVREKSRRKAMETEDARAELAAAAGPAEAGAGAPARVGPARDRPWVDGTAAAMRREMAELEVLELQRVQIMSSLVQAQMEYRKQQEEMELAMAISLSLAEAEGRPPAPTFGSAFGRLLAQPPGPGAFPPEAFASTVADLPAGARGGGGREEPGMSYEELVELEDVKVTATPEAIASLPVCTVAAAQAGETPETCSICQCDYEAGEERVDLRCRHHFHRDCASEWFSNYSKNCPVCKTELC